MNPNTIERMYISSETSEKKVSMPKKVFKRQQRMQKRVHRANYAKNMALFAQAAEVLKVSNFKKLANFERRKQHKVRYDTTRRQNMPTDDDIISDNLHYSNFLGNKYGICGTPYNTEYGVKLSFCDAMCESTNSLDTESSLEDEYDYYLDDDCSVDDLCSGFSTNLWHEDATCKRSREFYYEEPPTKRARCDDESFNV